MRGNINKPIEQKVLGKVYKTTVNDLKSNDLIKSTILVNTHWAHVLFTEVPLIFFICDKFFDLMKLKGKNISYELLITTLLRIKNLVKPS